jgi:hypothetical protein
MKPSTRFCPSLSESRSVAFFRRHAMDSVLCCLLSISFCLNTTADPSQVESRNEKVLHDFLDHPSQQTLFAISKIRDASLLTEITTDGAQLSRLCDEVSDGNLWSTRYLLSILHACDGASAECALNALGQFGDEHPEVLLDSVRQGMLTPRNLNFAVGTTPFELVDNIPARIKFLEARRIIFEKIDRKNLFVLKREALQAINESLEENRSDK